MILINHKNATPHFNHKVSPVCTGTVEVKEYLAGFTTNVLEKVSLNIQSTFVKKKSKHCENEHVNQYLFNQLPSFAFTRF